MATMLVVFVYFVIATMALALVFLPPVRALAIAGWQRSTARALNVVRGVQLAGRERVAVAGEEGRHAASALTQWLQHNMRLVLVALALLLGLPVLAVGWRYWFAIDTFDQTGPQIQDERIAALLAGERLVPPAPLPPAIFATREIEQARPLVRYASRDWALLDQEFSQRLLMAYRIMRERHGYEMVLLEGYRSPQRQDQLAALGAQVTKVGAFRSYHQFGLAADSAFLREGAVVVSEQDPWAIRGYELFGEVAASLGLTWGGGWKRLKDYGHVELRRPGVLGRSNDDAPPAASYLY